jgi:hypothetical protein
VGDIGYSPGNTKLVIDGHIILQGKAGNTVALVCAIMGCSLDLKGNAKITGNASSNQAGGVGIFVNSTFTMSDNAKIENNETTSGDGGGVSIGSDCIFIMNGGEISNNTTNGWGGGVHISRKGTFSVASEQVKAHIHSNNSRNDPQQVYVAPAAYGEPSGTFTVGGEPAVSF